MTHFAIKPLNKIYSQTVVKMEKKLKAVRKVDNILENVEEESSIISD